LKINILLGGWSMAMRHKTAVLTVLTIMCLTIMISCPAYAVGEPQISNNGVDDGLVITAPDPEEDISNLNPGDTKQSSLLLKNNGEDPFNVYIKTEILSGSENSPRGGKLAEIMRLTIKDGSTTIVDNITFREADQMARQALGRMDVGEQKKLDFIAHFPKEAGNEYQGASFQVTWIFDAMTAPVRGSTDTTVDTGDDPPPVPPALEESPLSPEPPVPFPPALEEGDTEPKPMPETGEASNIPFYAAGSLTVALGITLLNKKKS
jgi:LPXTG-motif cell wall-anchored protein